MTFYLLSKGVPFDAIYGYNDGWDLERLYRAFLFMKKQDLEEYRSNVLAVSMGASSLFKSRGLKKFMAESQSALAKIDAQRRGAEDVSDEDKSARVARQLSELGKVLGGRR